MHHLTIKVDDNSDPLLRRTDVTEVIVFVQNVNEYPPTVQPFVRVSQEDS